jgi:phosphoglycolate phosphatase
MTADDEDRRRAIAAAQTLPRPRAVIFDWDNTLIDSWIAIQDAQNHTLVTFGQPPWSLAETKQRVRGSMRDTYPQLFGERWLEAGEVFYRRFAERHLENLRPLPGAPEMLAFAADNNRYLAVVSNKKGSYLREEASSLGWERFFGRIIGAFDAPRDKPSPDPVHLALRGIGIATGSDVWFVGDADVDLQCAINAGCTPVLVRQEAPASGEFDGHEPSLHVSDCLMLSMVLRSL